MKTVYYAHFMGIYNTPQEERDVETLERLGLKVINPNTPEIQKEVSDKLKEYNGDYIKMFEDVFNVRVKQCDVFAFKALPCGKIPSGIIKEYQCAKENHKIIIELPSGVSFRALDKYETKEYLLDIGQR